MDGKEESMNKEGKGGGGDGFIDRSRVMILLCDIDSKSSEEAFHLLLKCSYQVTSVRSPRQVIDALNAEGPDIDLILAEVDLPMKKGLKLLKYITRDKDLRRIPVIMMSAKDEVSVVVNCLRLGAADYLVKPLRTNELLNIWTHMWRRRRMLGLAEKNLLNYEFDLVVSDPSDANTNSTNLFSDDTDERPRRSMTLEFAMSNHQEYESMDATAIAADAEPSLCEPLECVPEVQEISDCCIAGDQFVSAPKKSVLKIGQSSAFFTYVKSSVERKSYHGDARLDDGSSHRLRLEQTLIAPGRLLSGDAQPLENGEALDSYSRVEDLTRSTSIPDSVSLDRSCTPPTSTNFSHHHFREEHRAHVVMHPRSGDQVDGSGISVQNVYPYYMHGVLNQLIMPSSAQAYQNNLHQLHNHVNPTMLPQYNNHNCHMTGMASFPYYPVSMSLQPNSSSSWLSVGGTSSADPKSIKLDRREAALIKFRQKRKERCFDKKIRYVNRKKLAERRPRVRGQFVRKVNGVNVDLNGHPTDCDEDEEEDDDDRDSSAENDASGS